eukprot:3245416-Amphidinium_carterae.3
MFRAAKPTVDGRPLYALKDTSHKHRRASRILRFSRREMVQSGLSAQSLQVRVLSKTLYNDCKAVIWVKRNQLHFAGIDNRHMEVIQSAWESGGIPVPCYNEGERVATPLVALLKSNAHVMIYPKQADQHNGSDNHSAQIALT